MASSPRKENSAQSSATLMVPVGHPLPPRDPPKNLSISAPKKSRGRRQKSRVTFSSSRIVSEGKKHSINIMVSFETQKLVVNVKKPFMALTFNSVAGRRVRPDPPVPSISESTYTAVEHRLVCLWEAVSAKSVSAHYSQPSLGGKQFSHKS